MCVGLIVALVLLTTLLGSIDHTTNKTAPASTAETAPVFIPVAQHFTIRQPVSASNWDQRSK